MDSESIREFRNTMRKLERALDDQLQEGVQCCGVSLVQCHTLMELNLQEEINLKDLSSELGLDKSTVSRGIEYLVKRGLVERRTDSNNRRFVLISLSEKGKEVCTTINTFCDQYYLEVFRRIPQDKHPQVLESLLLFTGALMQVKNQKKIDCSDLSCLVSKKSEEKN